jgi:hypothetical protein
MRDRTPSWISARLRGTRILKSKSALLIPAAHHRARFSQVRPSPVHRTTCTTPCPPSHPYSLARISRDLVSTERPRKSITVCAKEASGLHYLVRCTLQRSPSQLGGKIPLSCTVYLSARALQELLLPLPDQAPNGVLLTTGSVAQSPGVPCPRLTPKLSVVFRSLDPKVTCVKKTIITQGKASMHLTSFGPAFRAFRCTQPVQPPRRTRTPDDADT